MFENFDNTDLRGEGYTKTFLLEGGTQVPVTAEPRIIAPTSDCPHAVTLSEEYGLTIVRNLNPQGSSGVCSWQVLDVSGEKRVLKAWLAGPGKRAQTFRAAYEAVQERPGLTRVMPLVHALEGQAKPYLAMLDKNLNYEVYVKTWSQIFDEFTIKHEFLNKELNLRKDNLISKSKTADEAVEKATGNAAALKQKNWLDKFEPVFN